MNTARPVSMQRVRLAIASRNLAFQEVAEGQWQQSCQHCIMMVGIEAPAILRFKARSRRSFHDDGSLGDLRRYVTASNRKRAFPKAYLEALDVAGTYTVSAEVNRLIASGLSELQFNAFIEHATHALLSFFSDFERVGPLQSIGAADA